MLTRRQSAPRVAIWNQWGLCKARTSTGCLFGSYPPPPLSAHFVFIACDSRCVLTRGGCPLTIPIHRLYIYKLPLCIHLVRLQIEASTLTSGCVLLCVLLFFMSMTCFSLSVRLLLRREHKEPNANFLFWQLTRDGVKSGIVFVSAACRTGNVSAASFSLP